MKTQGDTKRPRSVKAEFDTDFAATPLAGTVLAEKTLRSLNVRRLIGEHLPARGELAGYSTVEGVYALMAALLLGGRGISAAECLREDGMAREIFGLEQGAPSAPTMYRILCDLAGLAERKQSEVYESGGPRLPALDMLGNERVVPATRRIVPDEPEAAAAPMQAHLREFLAAAARRCFKSLPAALSRLHGWWAMFGDGTDLEVEGNCFDAARVGRNGEKILRWMTLMLGPILVAEQLLPGNRDEGTAMPELLESAGESIREMVGTCAKILALLDAAFFEKQVIERLEKLKADFIICANQQRAVLERLAGEQPAFIWKETGPDSARAWAESQVGSFVHTPEGWSGPVTIVARRWRKEDELPGSPWHYAFVGTRIASGDIPAALRKHGYCSAIWMLYGTKQGRENHYKTPLRDEGLHHPPSCRLGVNQAFYAVAAAASNIAMVLRYRVVEKSDRGIELWRLRERYFRIAGYLVRTGRTLTVRLSGVCVDALRQTVWRASFAEAGRL
jgi:hypothetical protein